MNEKVKKIFAWIGGILAGFFGLFVFVRSRDHRSGIADAEKRTADSGRAVEAVADRVGESKESVATVERRVDSVAGRIEDSKGSVDRIATGIDGARQGIAEGLRIIGDIEKRNGQ